MLYILPALLAILVLLLAFAVVHTLMIKAPAPAPCDTRITQEELDTAAKKTGGYGSCPHCVKK